MDQSASANYLDRLFKRLVILAIAITALILTKDLLVPIVFAALFSVVLLPVVKRLEKRIGRIFSISIVLLVSLLIVVVISWLIISQLSSLVQSLPDVEEKFYSFVNHASTFVNTQFKISSEEQVQLAKEAITSLSTYASDLLLSTSFLIYFSIQVPIYIFLFLYYRDRFNWFLLEMIPNNNLQWRNEIQQVIRGYISGLAIVVFIAGVLNSIGLFILGIDHAIFFGFLSGTLTMIPYVGITIGATLPALLALVTKDSAWYAVGVVGVHGVVQFLEGNFITPKVTGSRISINALAAVIALLIAGKIWGIAGMILGVPAVGVLKILLSYSSSLKPLVVLLGDEAQEQETLTSNE